MGNNKTAGSAKQQCRTLLLTSAASAAEFKTKVPLEMEGSHRCCSSFPHPLTCVVQVEGQDEVQEDVWKLLRGIRGVAVLHHAQKELNKFSIQVF